MSEKSLWQTVLVIGQYRWLLEDEIFSMRPDIYSDKALLSYKKTLLDYETYSILLFLWKESIFVYDDELPASSISRIFNGPISKYKIATTIHRLDNSRSLASYKHNVDVVMAAAEFAGFVELEKIHVNDSRVVVMKKLDDFMRSLAKRCT